MEEPIKIKDVVTSIFDINHDSQLEVSSDVISTFLPILDCLLNHYFVRLSYLLDEEQVQWLLDFFVKNFQSKQKECLKLHHCLRYYIKRLLLNSYQSTSSSIESLTNTSQTSGNVLLISNNEVKFILNYC